MPKSPDVITRFAPSPTGHLHIGGARTALFCWAFAKKNHGHFILRIEDTDQARSSDESAKGIMQDLAWLGIEWDEGPELRVGDKTIGGDPRSVGPFFQARRVPLYNQHIQRLVEQERAYPAFETAEELEAMRKAAMARKETFRYDRSRALALPLAERLARMKAGVPHVIRLLAPREEIVVHDQVLGDVRYAAGELDDFVLRKADGFPTYHFAVVVDDETMGVTHVMRAQEHLNNTPRHVALQRALGFRTPVYGHMPLIFNMDSTKMSKRDKAKVARATLKQAMQKDATQTAETMAKRLGLAHEVLRGFLAADNDSLEVAAVVAAHFKVALPEIEVADFRQNGYTPEAICNFLSLLGWNPGMKLDDGKDLEKFDNAFLAHNFSIERIGKTNARFDRQKLLSFNADAIAAMPDAAFIDRWRAWCLDEEPAFAKAMDERKAWPILARVLKPRAKTMRDGVKSAAFIALPDDAVPMDPQAIEKNLLANDRAGLKLLQEFASRLEALPEFSPEPIHALIEQLAKEKGFVNDKGAVNVGPIAQAIRVAVAGVAVSPPLGETLAAIGREGVRTRFSRCLHAVN